MTAWDDMALVGRIARAHGNRGQVIVDLATDFPEERFRPGSVLHIRRGGAVQPLTVAEVRFHRGRPIIAFAGVDTMDAAEALAAHELRISAEALHPLPPGSFYHHDLTGCAVVTQRGEAVGQVVGVEGDSAGSRLVVQGKTGEVLVPLAADICVSVDVRGRRIVIEPPEGLLELNRTKRQEV
jgi:16S rRNA processing protein RimM